LIALFLSSTTHAQGVAVPKTNPTKIYMNYAPWFETPETLGPNEWGFHWTFENRDPNNVDAQGRREIASHYYPLIGPYASSNPNVIEYHLLLMKMAGVDGVMIDWYGVQGVNDDIGSLLVNSNALINRVGDFGLQFGVVFEDQYAGSINDAAANMAYLRDNYFNQPAYIRQGAGNNPLVSVFGPEEFQDPAEWSSILSEAGEDVDFLTLWYQSHNAGSNADGEFAWPAEDPGFDNHLELVADFYADRAASLGTVGGVAYPGFNDFYAEGGLGDVVPFDIPHNDGQTLDDVLNLADQYSSEIDFLQLTTWNDFGEGTMFEPTLETGFDYLLKLQEFSGTPFGEAELQLVYDLYLARLAYASDPSAQERLDQVSSLLAALQIDEARALFETVPEPETWLLAAMALVSLLAYGWRRHRA
jgi:hypothetical protein